MRVVFVDANETLAALSESLAGVFSISLHVNCQPDITPEALHTAIGDAAVVLIDHTRLTIETAKACPCLRHVVFLGTGARSCMDPEALASLGITVHTISGYGDTAVAEMAVSLMWASAKSLARMDQQVRRGHWVRTDGVQLSGKTIGLVGFGGIARKVVGLVPYMRVLAWNRTLVEHPQVEFVNMETLLRSSDVVSLHLQLNDETRGFLSAGRLAKMRHGAILVNTARGALVDEAAMIAALRSGTLGHAGLDVFVHEPLPADHPLTVLDNVTLTAHSAFRTPEASENLVTAALKIVLGLPGVAG
jgi:D-3-phosphoglycerate dehydrogenase